MGTRGFIGFVADGTEKIVVDFDKRTFEAYRGFQKEPHDKGRFAERPGKQSLSSTYYPVALVAEWPLDQLPDDATFVAALEGDEDEEAGL